MRNSITLLAVAAFGLSACGSLPENKLIPGIRGTFTVERYLTLNIEGQSFNSHLAREYQSLAVKNARENVNWLDASDYANKSYAAAQDSSLPERPALDNGYAPWMPDEVVGVNADRAPYDDLVAALASYKDIRPAECAKAQAMWDQYLESLSPTAGVCLNTEEAKQMFDEALAACKGVSGDFVVYFGFGRSDLTDAGKEVVAQVVAALKAVANPVVSVVGHTDTVDSVQFNQKLSERRATTVAKAIVALGKAESVNTGTITTAGRSELELAVPTADNVKEARNRRATIAISN